MGQTTQSEWLIIVLIYNHRYLDLFDAGGENYFSMECQKRHLLQVFENIGFDKNYKVVLVENRLNFVDEENLIKVEEVINIFDKTQDALETVLQNKLATQAFTDPKKLDKILSQILSEYPAHNHAIVTFGHGSIFGINMVVAPTSLQPVKSKNITKFDCEQNDDASTHAFKRTIPVEELDINKFFEGDHVFKQNFMAKNKPVAFKYNDKKDEIITAINQKVILTNKELAACIEKTLPNKKLDVLVMYNCLMQNLFAQYDLRDRVDFLVAPVSGISHPGYNYDQIFSKLKQLNSPASSEQMADLFVSSINEDDAYYEDFKADVKGTWKITCAKLDPQSLEKIKALFLDLVNTIMELKNNGEAIFMYLNQTLNQCFNYSIYCLASQSQIDLLIFCAFLSEKTKGQLPEVNELANKICEELIKNKSIAFTGSDFFTDKPGSFVDFTFEPQYGNFGFGFPLQKKAYPKGTIQRDIYSNYLHDWFPDFLKDLDNPLRKYNFSDFYLAYTQANIDS